MLFIDVSASAMSRYRKANLAVATIEPAQCGVRQNNQNRFQMLAITACKQEDLMESTCAKP